MVNFKKEMHSTLKQQQPSLIPLCGVSYINQTTSVFYQKPFLSPTY